jgi:hypothetical protein
MTPGSIVYRLDWNVKTGLNTLPWMHNPPNLPVGKELKDKSLRNMSQVLRKFRAKHFLPEQLSNRY